MPTLSMTEDERKAVLQALSTTKNPTLLRVRQKLLGTTTSLRYAHDTHSINAVLARGYKERRNVKIR